MSEGIAILSMRVTVLLHSKATPAYETRCRQDKCVLRSVVT